MREYSIRLQGLYTRELELWLEWDDRREWQDVTLLDTRIKE